jgi:hypothetical protein
MGDWKSEMVLFIADEAVPENLPPSVSDFLDSFFKEHEDAIETPRTFDSYSNDQYIYLSLLMQCYDNPADGPLNSWHWDDLLGIRFHDQAACRTIAFHLDDWEHAFLKNPQPLCDAIHRELAKFETAFAPPALVAKVTTNLLMELYSLNDGRGYHVAVDSPAAALIADIPIRTNTLEAVNQSMGYIKAIRGWMRDADRQGMGLFSWIY